MKVILFSISLCIISCNNSIQLNEKDLIKEWHVRSSTSPIGNRDVNTISVLRLYSKNRYNQFGQNGHSYGIWDYNNTTKVLHLQPTNGQLEYWQSYYKIIKHKSNALELKLFRNEEMKPGTEELNFKLEGITSKYKGNDPFNAIFHKWRKKPLEPETKEQIKARVLDYLNFLKSVYEHAKANKFETIKMDWYPNPIQMYYSNGVRMANTEELIDWNKCFFDEEQAIEGYKIISGPFQNIELPTTNNKLERNLDVIEQLLKQINTNK